MRPLLVWLGTPVATVAHHVPGAGASGRRTSCGQRVWEFEGRHVNKFGLLIDWRLLNPSKVRLCRHCWGAVGRRIIRDIATPQLPPCERGD